MNKPPQMKWWQRLVLALAQLFAFPGMVYGLLTMNMTLTLDGKSVELYGTEVFYASMVLIVLMVVAMFRWSGIPLSAFAELWAELKGLFEEVGNVFKSAFKELFSAKFWRFALLYTMPVLITDLMKVFSVIGLVVGALAMMMDGAVTVNDTKPDLMAWGLTVCMYAGIALPVSIGLSWLANRRLKAYKID